MNSSYGSFESWDEWERLSEVDWARLSDLAATSHPDIGLADDVRLSVPPPLIDDETYAGIADNENYSYGPPIPDHQYSQSGGHVWPVFEQPLPGASSVPIIGRDRPEASSCEGPDLRQLLDHGTRPLEREAVHAEKDVAQESPAPSNTSTLADLFPELNLRRTEPFDLYNTDQRLQEQRPRFEGDMYTAAWVRGEGPERSGWCGFCSTWHRLKDSAFWYHMHYSHGISCTTGQPISNPKELRWSRSCNFLEGQCGGCNEWVALGKGKTRARTAYFRHAYKCFVKREGLQVSQSARRAGR